MRPDDVARAWGTGTRTIRNWRAAERWDRIPRPRFDAGGRPYWLRSEVMALIVGAPQKAPGESDAPTVESAPAVAEETPSQLTDRQRVILAQAENGRKRRAA